MSSLMVIAEIVFFGVYGISHFYPFKHSNKIGAVAAIVIAVILIIGY